MDKCSSVKREGYLAAFYCILYKHNSTWVVKTPSGFSLRLAGFASVCTLHSASFFGSKRRRKPESLSVVPDQRIQVEVPLAFTGVRRKHQTHTHIYGNEVIVDASLLTLHTAPLCVNLLKVT